MRINLNVNFYMSNSVSCKANIPKPAKIGFTNLDRISSNAEYDKILSELKNNNKWSGWWLRGNKFEQGIMPYAGEEDISSTINCFLRNNENLSRIYDNVDIETIIRILDYALQKLDEIYGKFEGCVYRFGIVENLSKGFVSTSKDPAGASDLYQDIYKERRRVKTPFYIISTKNGHKIEEVQKKLNYNHAYINETEILISPTKFKESEGHTPEMHRAKENLYDYMDKHHFVKPTITFLEEV